jgi:hypothetical protein
MAQERDGNQEAATSDHAPEACVGHSGLLLVLHGRWASFVSLRPEHVLQRHTIALTIV